MPANTSQTVAVLGASIVSWHLFSLKFLPKLFYWTSAPSEKVTLFHFCFAPFMTNQLVGALSLLTRHPFALHRAARRSLDQNLHLIAGLFFIRGLSCRDMMQMLFVVQLLFKLSYVFFQKNLINLALSCNSISEKEVERVDWSINWMPLSRWVRKPRKVRFDALLCYIFFQRMPMATESDSG